MSGPIRIAILANGSQARRELSSTGTAADRMGSRFSKLGGLVRSAALVGAAGIGVLGKAVVSQASDAQQSLGATESIFGRYADRVVAHSERAANAVGLSANEYRESANLLGSLLKNQGVQTDQLAQKTDALVAMGADLAATFGGPTRSAVEALASAFKGEFDPLEQYGISLKQSTVNTEALAVANVKTASEFNNLSTAQQSAAKQQAISNLLNKQGADAAGAFARESGTLAGQQQRLKADLQDVAAEAGTALLPMLTDLTGYARREVVPALGDMATWLSTNSDEIRETGQEIASALVPHLQTLANVGGLALDVLTAIPAPLRDISAQVGLAAYALPRLTGAFATASTSLDGYIGKARDAESRTRLLGTTARSAAGIGGLLALTQGASTSNDAISTLSSVGGGALLGFAVGGPIGAAIGGGAGALLSLADNADRAGNSISEAEPPAADFASTLDRMTGSVTRATRELAYMEVQEAGIAEAAAALGFSQRELVDALTGTGPAASRVQSELDGLADALFEVNGAKAPFERGTPEWEEWRNNVHKVRNSLDDLGYALEKDQREVRNLHRATAPLNVLYKGLPKQVVTRVRNQGAPETARQIARLSERYRLTPDQIRTVIRATGVDTTVKQVRGLQDRLKATAKQETKPKVQADPKPAFDAIFDFTRRFADVARQKARPKIEADGSQVPRIIASVNAMLNNIPDEEVLIRVRTVREGGGAGGGQRGSKTAPRLSDPGTGTKGLDPDTYGRIARGSRDAVLALLAGVTAGSDGVERALDKITGLVEKRINLKDSAKEAKREKQVLKALRDEYSALVKNGRAQEANANRLEKAIDAYRDLKAQADDYAASVRQGFADFGSIINLGQGTGFGSLDQMFDQWQARADKAEQFAQMMKTLADLKLDRSVIEQLTAAGVEGGFGTAQALLSGGQAAINQANALADRFEVAGNSLGNRLRTEYFGAGLQAAQGLVDGLRAKEAQLDRMAQRLANTLARAVKKALGIKSPSTVFRRIGDDTVKGLALGLDETYVRSHGKRLATDLTKGFGTPALDYYASASAQGQQPLHVDLRLTAEQVSLLQQGRQIQVALDAYQAQGGRRKS